MNKIKKIIFIIIISTISLTVHTEKLINNINIIINNKIITQYEIEQEKNILLHNTQIKKNIKNQIIKRKIIKTLQITNYKKKVIVKTIDINTEIGNIANRNHQSLYNLKNDLKNNYIDYKFFKKYIKENAIVNMIIHRKITKNNKNINKRYKNINIPKYIKNQNQKIIYAEYINIKTNKININKIQLYCYLKIIINIIKYKKIYKYHNIKMRFKYNKIKKKNIYNISTIFYKNILKLNNN